MKRLVIVVILSILLAGLILLGLGDNATAVADTSVPNSEIASSATNTGNSSASATITITMYAVDDG